MPRITPYDDRRESDYKFRNACPKLVKWRSRVEEADGDISKMRENAINRSPVFVAIQRGSRNIQIRTRTSVTLWKQWIQQGKRIDEDSIVIEHVHFSPKNIYRYQQKASLTSQMSPQKSPKRTIPVSPVKSPTKSPVKMSIMRAETGAYTGQKYQHKHYNVPMLTLTQVPVEKILKKRAKRVGKMAVSAMAFKGKWIEQDPRRLTVPGEDPYQYESSETEDDERRAAEILQRMLTPQSPTELARAKLLKRGQGSPTKGSPSPPKSPSKIRSRPESPMDNKESALRKIRSVGQTQLLFSPKKSPKHDDEQTAPESTEYESDEQMQEHWTKEGTIRKIKAMGMTRALLSPRRSPSHGKHDDDDDTILSPSSQKIRKKMRAVGQTSAAFSPRRPDGSIKKSPVRSMGSPGELPIVTEAIMDLERDEENNQSQSIGSLMTKLRFLVKLSPRRKVKEKVSGITSLMTKLRFLNKISPRRKAKNAVDLPDIDEEESQVKATGIFSLMTKLKFLSKLSSRKKAKDEDEVESQNKGTGIFSLMTKLRFLGKLSSRKRASNIESKEETSSQENGKREKSIKSGKSKKSRKSRKSKESGKSRKSRKSGETETSEEEKVSCFRVVFNKLCPCIAKKKEPELMEYQSGSARMMY